MKVPPKGGQPAPPPPKGGRPKGLTKRTVKGAAGGMLGVDYEDARRPDPFLKADDDPSIAEDGADRRRKAEGEGEADRIINHHRNDSSKDNRPDRSAFADEGRDQDAGDLLARTKQKKRIKKARESKESDEDQGKPSQEDSVELFEDGIDEFDPAVMANLSDQRRSDYFQDEASGNPGDLNLTNPDEIQRKLGSPMAYAKHIMILTEAFRRSTGADRKEALEYMAAMFLGPTDARFGWAALKEFGHGTGIIDIYPLEVIELVMDKYPGHLPKLSYGRILVPQKQQEDPLKTNTSTPLIFTYPENLRVRGFAIKGGGCPGYVFEPGDVNGTYSLHIKSPGNYRLLISTLNRSGYSVIDRLNVQVSAGPEYVLSEAAQENYPERDQERIDQWPKPDLSQLSPIQSPDKASENAVPDSKLMSAADLIHFKTISAMQGPKSLQSLLPEETPLASESPREEKEMPPPSVTLSRTKKATADKPKASNSGPSSGEEPLIHKSSEESGEVSSEVQKPNFNVPTPWSESEEEKIPEAGIEAPERLDSELSEADQSKLEQAVAAVLQKPQARAESLEEATQRIDQELMNVQEEQDMPTVDTIDLAEVKIRPSSIDLITEEPEHYTGEETQPMTQSDLEWIFEDPDATEVSDDNDD